MASKAIFCVFAALCIAQVAYAGPLKVSKKSSSTSIASCILEVNQAVAAVVDLVGLPSELMTIVEDVTAELEVCGDDSACHLKKLEAGVQRVDVELIVGNRDINKIVNAVKTIVACFN